MPCEIVEVGSMPRLAVNVDHVANIRQARRIDIPDPVTAAALAELAGAHGIVVHLREDRRHIQDRDVRLLRETVKTKLNLEMAATREMVGLAGKIKPDLVTLVPEKREELTTEGGLDVKGKAGSLEKAIGELRDAGISVSAFVDPEVAQIKASIDVGADIVELHTGAYAEAEGEEARLIEVKKIAKAATFASKGGLLVSAGHGLDYRNVELIADIDEVEELSIGHSIVARAVMVGMTQAVLEMLALIS
jgi:pyridoxine 5-phosphate synthase